MTGTELAIKLGYTVSKEGHVYNQNKLINTSIKKDKNKVIINSKNMNKTKISDELMRKLRSSVIIENKDTGILPCGRMQKRASDLKNGTRRRKQ